MHETSLLIRLIIFYNILCKVAVVLMLRQALQSHTCVNKMQSKCSNTFPYIYMTQETNFNKPMFFNLIK
jgi:hypothetical protein